MPRIKGNFCRPERMHDVFGAMILWTAFVNAFMLICWLMNAFGMIATTQIESIKGTLRGGNIRST